MTSNWKQLRSPARAALLAGVLACHGQPATALPVTQMDATERLHLDADLGKPVWQRAATHELRWQYAPTDSSPASVRTTVQVALDGPSIVFAIRAFDAQPGQIRSALVRRDTVENDQDHVVVYLDPVGRGKAALFARVNADGVMADGLYSADTQNEDLAPDFEIDAVARRLPDGYAVELRIPLSALRFDPTSEQAWQFLAMRVRPREQTEITVSSPLRRDAASLLTAMEPLTGVNPARLAQQRLSLRPTLGFERDAQGQRSQRLSVEAKWQPDPLWVLDLAWRPDFSQVELDVPQLTSNRQYAQALTEKRPFMLESRDMLETPSRSADLGGDGAMALYTRSVTDLASGLRATRRTSSSELALLLMDDRGGGSLLLPGTYGTQTVTQPANHASIVRLREHGDGGFSLGALWARKHYGALGENWVAGPDLVWPVSDALQLRAQALASGSTARANADGSALERGTQQLGSYVFADAAHRSPQADVLLQFEQASAGFRNDSGFVAQSGYRSAEGMWLGKLHCDCAWHDVQPYFWAQVQQATDDGSLLRRIIGPGVYALGPWGAHAELEWFAQRLERARAGGMLHATRQMHVDFSISPADWIRQIAIKGTWGDMLDVVNDRVVPGATWSARTRLRFFGRLEFEPDIEQTVLRASGNGPRVLTERALQWLTVLHLNAQNSLRHIRQRTFTQRTPWQTGDAAALDSRGDVQSLTWGWRQSVLRTLWLGATRSSSRGMGMPERTSTELFGKLSWDW